MKQTIVDKLKENKTISDEEFKFLLTTADNDILHELQTTAQEIAIANHGNIIKARGLIEVTNICKNNCLYCGIRASNSDLHRYSLSDEEILECCKIGNELGFKTFVMQGGEDPHHSTQRIADLIAEIRRLYPDTAITLSLGERSKSDYKAWYDAGANRYLLRHETADKTHYSKLHPATMSFENRIQCLENLKEIGFETGTGMMVGSPYQTIDNLISDLRFMEELQPHMIGIGPFVPHHSTPFGNQPAGSVETTLRLISILRLMHPKANIPATTSLGTLAKDGRENGILHGANVVMPNLSPVIHRKEYSLYDGKVCTDLEAAESRKQIEIQINKLGYTLE